MSTRHTMRKIREVLRLKYEQGCSQRQIQSATGLSKGSVGEYLRRAESAGMTWSTAEPLSDAELEARLFKQIGRNEPPGRTPIDFTWVHKDLRRTGVTLQQLCVEYQQAAVDAHDGRRPYQYSQFCDLYHGWRAKLDMPMRQTHRAGEKGFLDYSGKKPAIVDPQTGEVTEVELYVMVLGASNYTYAEATLTQNLGDFIGSTIRALEYFGAVPEMLVPDQLKSAVANPIATTPRSIRRSSNLPATTTRRSFPRVREKRVTRPRSRSACKLRSGGSWLACAIASSSASPSSTKPSPSCSKI